MRTIARAANASAYLAAPIQVGGSVIGTLHRGLLLVRPEDRSRRPRHALRVRRRLRVRAGAHLAVGAHEGEQRPGAAGARRGGCRVRAGCAPGAPLDLTDATSPARERHSSALLTRREAEIVELMARGARNAEIAGQLVISESTVKAHVGNILRKQHATNRSLKRSASLHTGRPTRRRRIEMSDVLRVLPPGVEEAAFDDALGELRRAVGDRERHRRPRRAGALPRSISVSARAVLASAVVSRDTEQVQAIVRIANETGSRSRRSPPARTTATAAPRRA